MARGRVELLLTRTVEHLGIVGDLVKVRPGYARNFLLPLGIAEHPSPEKIEALKEARATAQAELAALRSQRQQIVTRLEEFTLTLTRSCNDQGALYGSVTQRDISDALVEVGHAVDMRAVRLNQPIRRLGHYSVLIQFDRDLKAEIAIEVVADRELDIDAEAETVEAAPVETTDAAPEAAPTA
jgi:large subunit ribosomal protein L9